MIKNWTLISGPVTLSNMYQDAWVFETVLDAVRVIRDQHIQMCDCRHRQTSLDGSSRFILRDECGMTVPLWRIEEEVTRLGPRPRPLWGRFTDYDPERDFRKLPVSDTGKRRWGHCYRHMKTQQETRELLGLEFDMKDVEDFPVRIKIRKKRKNLPSLWDDICYSRRGDNWKHYRHTQHKEGRRKGGL